MFREQLPGAARRGLFGKRTTACPVPLQVEHKTKAAMQYFVQAFAARQPYPDKYDLLMSIATEEFSHLEIVGATITMLLQGVNGELKDAAEQSDLMRLLQGKSEREQLIQEAATGPQFLTARTFPGVAPASTRMAI